MDKSKIFLLTYIIISKINHNQDLNRAEYIWVFLLFILTLPLFVDNKSSTFKIQKISMHQYITIFDVLDTSKYKF